MARWRSNVVLNPSWPHMLALSAILFSIGIGLFRFFVLDWTDPMRCGALLNRGSWLDKRKFIWQPDGCMLYNYKPREAQQCFGSKQILFIGDSTTRKLFYQTSHILDNELPTAPPNDNVKHTDVNLNTSYGTDVSFIWDPYLNGTHVSRLVSGDFTDRPAMVVIGSGLWYLRYSNTSGGLPAWEANMERLLNSIAKNRFKIADSVVLLPVEQVVSAKLTPERATTMRPSDIDAMNSDLMHRIRPFSTSLMSAVAPNKPTIPVAYPRVFNQMLDASMTEDGLHYADAMVRAQATILLNMRCNEYLPKSFPLDKTCCFRYSSPSFVHTVILLAAFLSGPYVYYTMSSSIDNQGFLAWFGKEEAAPLVLGVAIALIYLADRSGLWLKEQKLFDPLTFGFLSLVSLFIGLATVKRSDKDLGLLNRDQTDEWKGWMQIAILIYHYLGASKISGIYNPIRVMVAAYLFMTGFGHTTYYLRKADFGFLRVAQVMVRLNLLTLILAYTMDTDYLSYYFAPLVSLWYLIIYATMAVAPRFNEHSLFVFSKIVVSAVLFTFVMREKTILESLFKFLEHVCNIRWSAREWTFRVVLDMWIVYVGMLFALAVNKFHSSRLSDDHRWHLVIRLIVGLSTVALVWFLAFELSQESKFTYNAWHPSISFIPVLAFVALRNATVILRSSHSRAFAFIGKCSLETFIIQYHFWLAGDTKGVLLVIPGTKWRPVNFMLTTFIFIYLSDRVANATAYFTTQICGGKPKTLPSSTADTNRSGTQSRAGLQSENVSEGPEATKELYDALPMPAYPKQLWIRSLLGKLFLSVKGRLSFILLLMWMVNLMWTREH